jgi:Protein of unknown function (DUF2975)
MRPDLDAAPDRGADRKLTQPLGGALKFILVLVAVLLFVVLLGSFLPGPTQIKSQLFGCVRVNGIAVTATAVPHLRPGATASAYTVQLCASHPTAGQRVLVFLTFVPTIAFYLAVLLLLGQLLRTVRTAGPFALIVARRLYFLGWFVLAGSLVVAVGQSVAQSAFVSTVLTGPVPAVSQAFKAGFGALWAPLLIACGLLTLARVIRAGARMSEDLAGTV